MNVLARRQIEEPVNLSTDLVVEESKLRFYNGAKFAVVICNPAAEVTSQSATLTVRKAQRFEYGWRT